MFPSSLTAIFSSDNPRATRLFCLTAFLLGVAIPTSNLLMNVFFGLVLVCVGWQRDMYFLRALLVHPLVWLPALMFAFLAVSLVVQPHAYGSEMLNKYKKLLYILPLALFFLQVPQTLQWFLRGFLLSNAVILTVSLAVGVLHLPLGHIDPLNPTVFKLHITQNFFMALAALLWLAKAFSCHKRQRGYYAILVVLACYDVLFLVLGRTGYVALIVGLGMWILLSLSNRQRLAAVVFGVCMLFVLIFVPNRAAERVERGITEIHACLAPVDGDAYYACKTSMGQRTAFVNKSWGLIKQSPWFGHGAGSFWYGNPETGYSVNNPHNQYLLEAVQSGLVGLAVFLLWMACCYREAWQQPQIRRHWLVAILSSYLACHLFNSFLLDSAEGHFFVVIAAGLACGALRAKRYSGT